ncbi:MAG TPA: tetratricopeptide repeat protein [Bacteroidales bacterium]|nr:tetratricopeptide repeat protein [Bacteroidales bacterium]
MGTSKRKLLLILLFLMPFAAVPQEQRLSFREADSTSYVLYAAGEWKQLTRYCNRAFADSIDYYYLRMRAGIAAFETERYMRAALHFGKALEFNAKDPVAGEYLYGCYLRLNRPDEARTILEDLPPSVREKLEPAMPYFHRAILETGPLMSNEMTRYDTVDLDGPDDLYGEADITLDGYYLNAGVARAFKGGYNVYLGYTLVKLNKNKIAETGDSLSVDDQYPLYQHQYYASGIIPVRKNYSVQAAFHYISNSYETVMPRLAADSLSYLYPREAFTNSSWIGYLSVTRDLKILKATLFGAISSLNDLNQYQGGFQLTAFPFGNLNLYTSSKLIDHINDNNHNFIFEQMAGVRLFRPLWLEASATFGNMENYHENSGFVVYNIADKMTFKGNARLIYAFHPRWTATAGYSFLVRESSYVQYLLTDDLKVERMVKTEDFQSQVILLGLDFNF